MSDLPPGWIAKESSKFPGKTYYFNQNTGESVWEKPPANSAMRALHILVKHSGSRRPSSWKQEKITRPKQEAIDRINEFKAKLQGAGPNLRSEFSKIASVESDCSSAKNGGDLGSFSRGDMQKPFEEAVLSIKEGELVGPVDTDSGIHLILRVPVA